MRKPRAGRRPWRAWLWPAAQNGIIALLCVSAVLLAVSRAGLSLGGSIGAYGGMMNPAGGAASPAYGSAAEPMCVVVTPEDGAHDAAMYSQRELDEAYALYGAALAEALGSAGEPQPVSAGEWRDAVSGSGVYFDYYTGCQLSSFAIWLGADMASEARLHSARRLCLSLQDGEVALYYMRELYGEAYRCTTELSYSELAGRVAASSPDGAQFVFELGEELDGVDPFAVMAAGEISVHSLESANSLDRGRAEELMAAFGMNANLANNYPSADGADVYLEGSATLRLGADGRIIFTRRGAEGDTLSPSDAVQLTRSILESTVGLVSGAAELRLSYISLDAESGEYTLRYDYAAGGLPVELAGRSCAAEFTLSGRAVTGADILLRSYSYTGASENPLPARLAAAWAKAAGGGEPRLVYIDDGGAVRSNWVAA